MGFLDTFQKELTKIDGISTSSEPPRYWYSAGNYVLNRIISGSFLRGIPQGRITTLAGASGTGKSFLAANLVKSAQENNAIVLVVDSENALDNEFMNKIGVKTGIENNYFYVSVTTINQVVDTVSRFLKGYKKDYENDPDAPQVFILIDSLDMLLTETELEHYTKGDQKGDQGQRNKQLKQMLRNFVQDIKSLNVSLVCTAQVYKNQDIRNGEGVWIVSDAVKYSASLIVLLTKLKLKDSDEVVGIRMKAEGYKTRFTKPFQTVVIEVPYEEGMSPTSGLLEVATDLGVVTKAGARYRIEGEEESWFAKNIDDRLDVILKKCEEHASKQLRIGENE